MGAAAVREVVIEAYIAAFASRIKPEAKPAIVKCMSAVLRAHPDSSDELTRLSRVGADHGDILEMAGQRRALILPPKHFFTPPGRGWSRRSFVVGMKCSERPIECKSFSLARDRMELRLRLGSQFMSG